jgi:hypothetical protein
VTHFDQQAVRRRAARLSTPVAAAMLAALADATSPLTAPAIAARIVADPGYISQLLRLAEVDHLVIAARRIGQTTTWTRAPA